MSLTENFMAGPQSRQSAKLFLQSSSELGLPPPLTRRRMCTPPLWFRGAQSLGGEGVGVPIRTRGQTLWHSRYICTWWAVPSYKADFTLSSYSQKSIDCTVHCVSTFTVLSLRNVMRHYAKFGFFYKRQLIQVFNKFKETVA
jgi:hypothetical protein